MKNVTSFVSPLVPGFLALFFLQACGGAASTPEDAANDARITRENRQVALVGGVGSITLSGPLLTLNASIAPPTGEFANDVFVRGTNAYVSYNVPGTTASGAIDQISVLVPTVPTRTATFNSTGVDINGVYVDALSNVYAIGGDGVNGSVLQQLTAGLSSFSSVTGTFTLPSFAGTAVKVWGTKLFTLTGNNGGLNSFNVGSQASTASPNLPIVDARGMDQNGLSNLWVVAGGGNLYEVSSTNTILNTVTFSGANAIAESKSNVHVGSTVAAVSLGNQGSALVCMSDRHVIATIPAPVVSGVDPSLTVSNSVTFGDGLMFVANGAAGVYVYTITNPLISNLVGGLTGAASACGSMMITYQGYLDLGSSTASSVNNVYYAGGVLYVATGTGGFKVLTVNLSVLALVTGVVNSI